MSVSAAAGHFLRRSVIYAAFGCVIAAWANESSGLEPFVIKISGKQTHEIEAGVGAALANRIVSIVEKPKPSPTGDAHDYVSFARYYWPNPDTPSHLPFVRRDGRSNNEQVALSDEPRLQEMDRNVVELAEARAVLRREDCARRAVEWLRVWFVDPATIMHPNLEWSQIALGHDGGRGRAEGILDARGFVGVVDALRMLHGSPALGAADEAAIHAWFNQYLQWLLTSKNGAAEHLAANNHGTWFLAQSIAIARYVGRDDVARGLANEDFARITSQIEPDGRQPLELARTDSLDYSTFNLSAQYLVARLSAGLGVDLAGYTAPSGASLANAVEYLRPYNMTPDKWPGREIKRIEPGFLNEVLEAKEELAAARR
jgi:hypothetical protein